MYQKSNKLVILGVLWLSDNIIIEEKMIANAFICMAEYDNREIVDWDDIHHFHEKGCSFEVLQLCDVTSLV